MNKGKVFRLGGFVAALSASAALVASAAGATGAYFTDSHSGSINPSTGHLSLSVSATTLSFAGLVPGEYPTKNISYTTSSSTNEDLWLVFDSSSDGYQAFTGPKSNSFGGGLGRYGHFAVAHNNQVKFTSYNLQNVDENGGDQCPVNANGDGGSNQQATSAADTPPLCGVPAAIKLASNLVSGSTGEIEITFGVTGRWVAQNSPVDAAGSIPFKIVATQTGVRPDAANY